MPLFLILLMIASCLPLPWPARPFGMSALSCLLLTIGMMLISVITTRRKVFTSLRELTTDREARRSVARSFGRFQRRIPWVTLALWLIVAVPGGWAFTVREQARGVWSGYIPSLYPFAELLVSLPYFLTVAWNWYTRYPLERLLFLTSEQAKKEEVEPAFWSRGRFMLFQARSLFLYLGLPMGLCATQQTLARAAPEFSSSDLAAGLSIAASLLLFICFPWFVPRLLGFAVLPAGEYRDEFERASRRVGVTFAQFYVWHTHGQMINAMVLGVVSRLRFVVFTDRLLDELTTEERLAVFGHEAGHARHYHLPFYLLFLLLSGVVIGALSFVILTIYDWPTVVREWSGLLSFPLFGVYLFVVFGWLSRRCERQADVFGCRVASCARADCTGHDAETILGGRHDLCRTGCLAMVAALERVGDLTGTMTTAQNRRAKLWALLRAWQHGSMQSRIDFLLRMSEDQTLAAKADRRAWNARLGLCVLPVAAIVAFGTVYGWDILWKML